MPLTDEPVALVVVRRPLVGEDVVLRLRRLEERVARVVFSAFDSVYETRTPPHGARRVPSDSVSPLNQASPSASYWLMLPNAGFGRPRFGDAEQRGLRRRQRRHVDVVRHEDAVAADVRIAGLRRERTPSAALDLHRRLLVVHWFCTSGLMLLIETSTPGGNDGSTAGQTGAPAWPKRQHRGLIFRAVALDARSRSRAAECDRNRDRRSRG